MWCFQCGAEYEAGATETCLECGVGLVDEPPMPADAVGDADEEQLAYEFHDWAFESRRMLDQLLTGEQIAHAWQGATMIVRVADEDRVDELVEQVEHTTLPTLDPELEHSVYEMAGWSDAQQSALSRQLGIEGVPHEFDQNGDLVIHTDDEERVDEILDRIEDEGIDDEGDGDGAEATDDDGEPVTADTYTLLNNLFDAADRLRKNARDPSGVLAFYDHGPALLRVPMPYGYERPEWRGLTDLVRTVLELLDAEDSDDGDIRERAGVLRDALVTRL